MAEKQSKNGNGLVVAEVSEVAEAPSAPTVNTVLLPKIRIEGLAPIEGSGDLIPADVAKAIALAAKSTGQTPEVVVAKVLSDAFNASSSSFSIINLYRLLARNEHRQSLNAELSQIEQMKTQKQMELDILNREAESRQSQM
jgi:hypothetical protein